jgi:hypothetical protein
LASLFGSSKKPEAPKMKKKCAMKKEVEKKEESYDSDEDEMEIKNYMMEKNDDFE